ncbi:septum formation initiator family protein [Candidatus Saccharibacteria bacterium]|nr:septum formation initiator family protein [Candidatus Saccharibacteria bacterium]MCL1963236.1 septum formation initiator family protein [Candidatus Saccharibacteria bacterium]
MLDQAKKYLTMNNIILIVVTIFVLSWVWSTISALNKNYGLEKRINETRAETEVMKLQNEKLKLEQAYYKTDEYLELQARKLLNKSFDGEHLVILPKTAATEHSNNQNSDEEVDKTNFEKWMDFLFGQNV